MAEARLIAEESVDRNDFPALYGLIISRRLALSFLLLVEESFGFPSVLLCCRGSCSFDTSLSEFVLGSSSMRSSSPLLDIYNGDGYR